MGACLAVPRLSVCMKDRKGTASIPFLSIGFLGAYNHPGFAPRAAMLSGWSDEVAEKN